METTKKSQRPPRAVHIKRGTPLSPLLTFLEQKHLTIILSVTLFCALSVLTVTLIFAGKRTMPFSTATALLGMAQREYAEEHYEKAIALLEELHEGRRGTSGTERMLGNAFFHVDDLESAEKHYVTALKADPSDLTLLMNLALTCYRQNHFEEAATHYQRIRDTASPQNVKIRTRAATSLSILEEQHGVRIPNSQ